MEDNRERDWDMPLKIVGLFGIVIGSLIGIGEYVYSARQQAALETAKFEAEQSRLLLEKQTELYFKASELAARISTESDVKEKMNDFLTFQTLYYGPMVIVEDRVTAASYTPKAGEEGKYATDRNVERRMIAFHDCYLDHECAKEGTLQNLSLQLADACRLSLLLTTQGRVNALSRLLKS